MSQAETLLQSLTEEVTDHTHIVTDHDSYFVINPDTRVIENASRIDNVLMQFDHNSEVYTFELARYVEGHDMTLCNRVRVHFNNIDGTTLEENCDVAELYDLDICPDDENKVLCSWTITRQATQLVGTLNFLVQYECIDENGDAVYEWHTDIYTDVEIKKTINNAEQAIVEYSNVLEQWYQRIFGSGDAVLANITAEGENQVAAVAAEGNKQVSAVAAKGDEYVAAISNEGTTQKEAIALKGEETLTTIPEDYTATYNMAEEALRRKANAIELEASGEIITIDDASDAHLLGLNVYGKSTQFTTTGKNLFNAYAERNESFANAVVENNGAKIVVTGNYYVSWPIALKAGVEYYVDFKVDGDTAYRAVRFEYPDKEITNTITNPATFTPSQDTVSVYLYAGLGTEGTVVYNNVQISEGSTALSWEPYTGGAPSPNPDYPQEIESVENPTVSIYGKNLANVSAMTNNALIANNDGSFTMTKIDESSRFSKQIPLFVPAGMPMTISFDTVNNNTIMGLSIIVHKADGSESYITMSESTVTRTYDVAVVSIGFYMQIAESDGAYITFKNFQFALSDMYNDYEPYKPVQTLTIDRTLSGIPVTSGGNYTDSTGQQWICDEIDLERGVYIQRIYKRVIAGTEYCTLNVKATESGVNVYQYYTDSIKPLDSVFYCSHFTNAGRWDDGLHSDTNIAWQTRSVLMFKTDGIQSLDEFITYATEQYNAGTPIAVSFAMETPIETPLTEEEIAYYKKLKTNYHDTVVFNDRNTHMTIKYAADTLIYMRDHQPKPTDEQVANSVNVYLDQNGVQVPSDAHIKSISDKSISETISKLNIPSDDDIKNIADSAISEAINKLDITSSWNDLTDKPFYSEITPDFVFTEEDIANPIERIEIPDGGGMAYVKVSDRVFTADELDGMSVTYIVGGDNLEPITTTDLFIDKEHTMIPTGIMFSSMNDGTALGVVIEQETNMGFRLSTGLWLIDYSSIGNTKILSVTIPGKETVKTLDSKFLNPALQFGETTVKGDTLTWDGNTDGLVSVVDSFYKVADNIVTADELANGFSYKFDYGEVIEGPAIELANGVLTDGDAVIFVDENGAGAIIETLGDAFPEPGIYLAGQIGDFYVSSLTIPGYNGFETKTVTPIDPKFLPETASPDWNAAEGEPGHVLNKPFYEESKEVTETFYPSRWSYNVTYFDGFHLTVGTTYHVSLDGTEYSGVCVAHLEGADKGVMLLETSDAKVMLGEANNIVSMFVVGIDKPTEVVIRYQAKNVKTIDPKFLPKQLQFGEPTVVKGDTLTWDGNVEGLESVDAWGTKYYHIPTDEIVMSDFYNGFTATTSDGDSYSVPAEDVQDNLYEGTLSGNGFMFVPTDGFNVDGVVFPKAGIYAFRAPDDNCPDGYLYLTSLTIPGFGGLYATEVRPIDPKFLPETAKVDKDEIVNSVLEALPTWTGGGSY